jgi:DNA-binding NtrC family response regulator
MSESGNSDELSPAPYSGEDAGLACLYLDRRSGKITACNDAATALLGVGRPDLCGKAWSQLALCNQGISAVLEHMAGAGLGGSLPPFLVRCSDGSELVLGGVMLPGRSAEPDTALLQLWLLQDARDLQLPSEPSASDTLAVLGVDQLPYGQQWAAAETPPLMADIRGSLLEILRIHDSAALPVATNITFLLREVDTHSALDISRALLSHLQRQHMSESSAAANARICIGLAPMAPGKSALSTLLEANNALLRAQCASDSEKIRVARDEDASVLAGRVVGGAGAFSGCAMGDTAASDTPAATVVPATARPAPLVQPIEKGIEGYVGDNMEGAVDQAVFLSRLDIPVAIIGPVGTGKLYVAKIIHEEAGGKPDMVVAIDCREFRGRAQASKHIARELAGAEGKTLIFKSPHLMNLEAQNKLARQISSRTLADVNPPRYMPKCRLLALFPDGLEQLITHGGLSPQLASAFAGYPIYVPPIKDRKQAVLRWAHKILEQEGIARGRDMKGFTPDAEQAMLLYDWPGNISEMRQCLADALDKTARDWLTPVDLGLFKGVGQEGLPYQPQPLPFLAAAERAEAAGDDYVPTALEAVDVALGEALHGLLASNTLKPLGTWIEDEVVLAVLDRYRGDMPRSAAFLHTRSRNISRWLPKMRCRDEERNSSALWQKSRRLIREWVRESPQPAQAPLLLLQGMLMSHMKKQCDNLSTANQAGIMGVSTPTWLKRLRESGEDQHAQQQ